MKSNTQSVKQLVGILNAAGARAQTSRTAQEGALKHIEREILDHAHRGHTQFISKTCLCDLSLNALREHGYVAELCENDIDEQVIGTFISWK